MKVEELYPVVSAQSVPECLQHESLNDALLGARMLIAFLRRVSLADIPAGEDDLPVTYEEREGQQLVYALLSDKLRIASGELAFPLVDQYPDEDKPLHELADLLQAGAVALSSPPERTTHKAASEVQEAVARLEKLRENMVIMSCSGGGVVPEIFDKTAATLADVIALLKKTTGV